MSELTRLRDEAARLSTIYHEHKDSADPMVRRQVHVALDRFLMEHRDTAVLCMERVLSTEIEAMQAKKEYELPKPTMLQRLGLKLYKSSSKKGVPM